MKFLREALGDGHREEFYDTLDQRFLGNQGFVEEVQEKAGAGAEIEVRRPRVGFSELVRAVAKEHGVDSIMLVQRGRGRRWVRARSMLVYLGREWSRLRAKELGERLHRDPSLISRWYHAYAANRDLKAEERLAESLRAAKKVHSDSAEKVFSEK